VSRQNNGSSAENRNVACCGVNCKFAVDRLRQKNSSEFHTITLLTEAQGLWYQDFPAKAGKSTLCDFEETLVDYIQRLGVGSFCSIVRKYDFTSANAVLLTSVPGIFKGRVFNFLWWLATGAEMHKFGHMRVRALLEKHSLSERFRKAPLLCQVLYNVTQMWFSKFSSMGSITSDWLELEFLKSLTGLVGL
jgi:tyrosyl-DNA phosphodiesterase-1